MFLMLAQLRAFIILKVNVNFRFTLFAASLGFDPGSLSHGSRRYLQSISAQTLSALARMATMTPLQFFWFVKVIKFKPMTFLKTVTMLMFCVIAYYLILLSFQKGLKEYDYQITI